MAAGADLAKVFIVTAVAATMAKAGEPLTYSRILSISVRRSEK